VGEGQGGGGIEGEGQGDDEGTRGGRLLRARSEVPKVSYSAKSKLGKTEGIAGEPEQGLHGGRGERGGERGSIAFS